jgi:hypothetical protein
VRVNSKTSMKVKEDTRYRHEIQGSLRGRAYLAIVTNP